MSYFSDRPAGTYECDVSVPLGASPAPGGMNFVVFSINATSVDLCLLEVDGSERRIPLFGPTQGRWSVFVPGVAVGSHYGYRVRGPWDPMYGHLFNYDKLILDPYARGISSKPEEDASLYAHSVTEDLDPDSWPLEISSLDSAPSTSWGVVTANSFPIHPSPQIEETETVIMEAHVKGFTQQMPGVAEDLRGTYAGLASDAVIEYLLDLGINTLELLPVHAKWDETFLRRKGLTNYWGYSTLNYFYPEPSYATAHSQAAGPQAVIDEFRGMVSILHSRGIRVVLDVVYNHTCEGANRGPALSWRGMDNATYYMQDLANPGNLADVTGTGNSLDFTSPAVISMALDSMRYWVSEMGVDGFRFDLGVTLARKHGAFDRQHPFLVACASDPVLRGKILIMEPWDVGYDGWHTGDFPVPFKAWNDRFRSDVRDFWLSNVAAIQGGVEDVAGQSRLATRLAGSADLFYRDPNGVRRRPLASVNFVSAHDGFTVADLVSFNRKHNEANMEDNCDGSDDNRSWNFGREMSLGDLVAAEGEYGPTAQIRLRVLKNMLATLLVSAGTPMLVAGDEFGRSQQGNNNAYCQDSPISWLDWQWAPWQANLHQMIRLLIRLRRVNAGMRPRDFATGKPFIPTADHPDLAWYSADGSRLESSEWSAPSGRVLQMHRCAGQLPSSDLLAVINGGNKDFEVKLAIPCNETYELVWDSSWTHPSEGGWSHDLTNLNTVPVKPGATALVPAFSMRLYLSK